jgi:hypothetical protein
MVRLKMEKIEWELIPENKLREWAEVLKFDIDIDFSRRDPALSSGHMFSLYTSNPAPLVMKMSQIKQAISCQFVNLRNNLGFLYNPVLF